MPRIKPLQPEQLSADTKQAFEKHVTEHHSKITNMKATMGRSVLTFHIYMQWYDLYGQVKSIVGERAAYLFAHAISLGSNCPLCTTYFRKLIIEKGEDPAALALTEAEQHLLDFGSAMANNKGEVPADVYGAISKQYTEEQIILLVGFAGQMIATNIFNNALHVEIDGYLAPYVPLTSSHP